MNKMILALAGSALLFSMEAKAEDAFSRSEVVVVKTTPIIDSAFMVYGGWGKYNQSFEKFNNVLRSQGIANLDNTMNMITFGFYSLIRNKGRSGVDLEVYWTDAARAFSDSATFSSASFSGFNIACKGGYDIVNTPRFGLMPLFSPGYYLHTYDFRPRFSDVLDQKIKKGVQFYYTGISLSAGLEFQLKARVDTENRKNGRIIQGLARINGEFGIHYYPLKIMRVTGGGVDDGFKMPDYGIYAKVTLNLGGKSYQNSSRNTE